MQLIIVESPTKARTISKFLGKEYAVKSSFGHVRDLPTSTMGVDIEHGFKPHYIIPAKAKPKVAELKELAAGAKKIILASDEDREGEAIAWHLTKALGLGISNQKPKTKQFERIVFHEITKGAIEKALENPRDIDMNLVDAQQARRVLDRLVGYELSPFLWKKIKKGLSAGRVQSVALRFIAEREREIEKFKEEEYWTIAADLKKAGASQKDRFSATLTGRNGQPIEETVVLKLFAGEYKTKKTLIANETEAAGTVEQLEKALFEVKDVAFKEITRTPQPPFTTSTLQQSAINTLGFSSEQTMRVAQKLYEEGHITYMRTDSVNLSLESMLAAKKLIAEKFGPDYALENPRFFTTKSKGAQEAHEAIRPTFPEKTPEDLKPELDPAEYRLYRLVWQRMIAGQMQPSVMNSLRVDISAAGKDNIIFSLEARGSTIKFDGYLRAYEGRQFEERLLPDLKKGDALDLLSATPTQKTTTPPPRYTEAGLVKILEEYGIGRPSTYAPTISTIIKRKYIDKNEEKRLIPLEIGFLVNDVLVEHFHHVVDPRFTAEMESNLDEVADGKKEWTPVVKDFYFPFHENIEKKTEQVKKKDILEKLDRKCPECGGDLIVKFGRFGKFIACANFPSCKYTEKTEQDKKIEAENSGVTCDLCGAPMVVKHGKFGPFLGCSRYPECKNIKRIENKTGIRCPKCQEGEIVERKSKRGKTFFGCNAYPRCDFALWSKPTGETCSKCGSLMVFAAKGTTKCSNKECS